MFSQNLQIKISVYNTVIHSLPDKHDSAPHSKCTVRMLHFPSFKIMFRRVLAIKTVDLYLLSQHFLFGHTAVFPLFLGREENAVSLLTPFLLRDVNGGRWCGVKHGTVSLFFVFVASPHSRLSAIDCWTNLACKLTEQAKDDRPRIMDVDWTYREEGKKQRMNWKW